MAKIQNIKIGDTSYQIKDGSAVQFVSSLPTASADYLGKLLNNISDGKLYICTKTSQNQYVWNEYLALYNAVRLNENNVGNLTLTGNLSVAGNITQQGKTYVTEAEKVQSKDDYIVMRHGNTSALAAGQYSGYEVENYDGGGNKLRLVVDNKGVARVGDVGEEQPLLTRSESSDLTDKMPFVWNATAQKAVNGYSNIIASNKNLVITAEPVNLTYSNPSGGEPLNHDETWGLKTIYEGVADSYKTLYESATISGHLYESFPGIRKLSYMMIASLKSNAFSAIVSDMNDSNRKTSTYVYSYYNGNMNIKNISTINADTVNGVYLWSGTSSEFASQTVKSNGLYFIK